jgi:hypothetical protein
LVALGPPERRRVKRATTSCLDALGPDPNGAPRTPATVAARTRAESKAVLPTDAAVDLLVAKLETATPPARLCNRPILHAVASAPQSARKTAEPGHALVAEGLTRDPIHA